MKKFFGIFIFLVFFSSVSIFAQAETEKGIARYRSGDFDGAISALEKVVAADKQNRKAWTYLGASLFKKGDRKAATKAFKNADAIAVAKESPDEINDGLVIKSKPRPSYTDLARRNDTQGDVKLAVEFGADGQIKSVFVVSALRHGLTESAIEALKKIEIEPAQKDGKPVSVVALIEYKFRIY